MDLQVLSALDKARTQWYHFSAIIVSGMGFFTGAYNMFCIPPITTLLGRIYYQSDSLPPHVDSIVNGIALIGTIAGHLFFGRLGDTMGRKKVYLVTILLMLASSIASGFSVGKSRYGVITCLCFFRFWLGVGIGGDVPLSTTIMAEISNTKTRGAFMASVYAMQGLGILAASAVCAIVSACFRSRYPNSTHGQEDIAWRIIVMLGAVPAGLTYYWRMKVPESPRYVILVARNAKQPGTDTSSVLKANVTDSEADVSQIETRRRPFGLFSKDFAKLHGLRLVGAAASWFFIDIPFYSNNMLQKYAYKNVGLLRKTYENGLDEVFDVAKVQALNALIVTLPGYLLTVFLIDRFGRLKIQFGGFLFMAACIFTMAVPSNENYWTKRAHRKGFLAVYALTFLFSNLGPSTTALIVPAELFPARLRSTCHGISGAAGKVGAIIGVFGFMYAAQPRERDSSTKAQGYPRGIGIHYTLIILGVTSLLGCLTTFLLTETKGRSLDENEVELPHSDEPGSGSDDSSEDSMA